MKSLARILAISGILIVVFAVVGSHRAATASGTQNATPAPVKIGIDNFSFNPAKIDIPVGTTVTWTNQDDVPHTIVSAGKRIFRSQALDTGDKFSYTFTKPGIYRYFCSVHPVMTAEIIVK